MPIRIETKGPLFARPTARVISVAFREAAGRHGPTFVKRLKEQAPKDRKTFSDAIDYRVTGSGINSRLILFSDAPDAEWAEKGRKPGKQPPLEPGRGVYVRGKHKGEPRFQSVLTPWFIRRGVPYEQAVRLGFLSGRKQAREGRPGAYVFRDFIQNNAEQVAAFFDDFGGQLVRAFSE